MTSNPLLVRREPRHQLRSPHHPLQRHQHRRVLWHGGPGSLHAASFAGSSVGHAEGYSPGASAWPRCSCGQASQRCWPSRYRCQAGWHYGSQDGGTEAAAAEARRATRCRSGCEQSASVPPQAQPKEKAPPPPLNADNTTADPPSQPPAQGASSEADRAPLLAADAPASRVGSVINDGSGNPALCLVQLWACRRKCGVCENAFCQATFPDRSNSSHTLHRCRDCKRAEGRARLAQQAPASSEDNWQHSSWEWNSSAWTPAWGSQGGWQEGWHHGVASVTSPLWLCCLHSCRVQAAGIAQGTAYFCASATRSRDRFPAWKTSSLIACSRSALGSLMHLSTQAYCVDSRFCPGSSNAFVRRGRVKSAADIARFRLDILGSHFFILLLAF